MIVLGAILAMSTILPVIVGIGLTNRRLREQLSRNRAERATASVPVATGTIYPVLAGAQRSARVTKVTRHGQQWRVVEPERLEVIK